MSTGDLRARYASVTAGARVFALIVLAPPVAISGEYGAVVSIVLLASVWLGAVFADGLPGVAAMPALTVEACLVSFLATLTMTSEKAVLLPALVIPPLIGGLVRGSRGTFEVVGAEVAICLATIMASDDIKLDENTSSLLFTWLMAGFGLGLITAFVRRSRSQDSDTATSYRDARVLITQLLELSGELVDGLDPVSIGQNILDLSREEMPLTGAVVYTRTPRGLVPLIAGKVPHDGVDSSDIVREMFDTGQPVVSGPWAGFPLVTDAGVVAVVVGGLSPVTRPATPAIRTALAALSQTLQAEALQLDTALLFSAVRDEATAEERRRLARDLHDGVAQDMASLGYRIDELAETAGSPQQADRCRELRAELTEVVAELRRSVFLLRNESGNDGSLGASIQAVAQHIENRSGIAVHVELNEGSNRLRPDVEAELLRITQEGMNNAVKHSRATQIRVQCNVHAPDVEISVTDNGRGLQSSRDDSHGVRIMRERARRIGATLALRNVEGRGGVELTVVLDRASRSEGPGSRLEGMVS